MAKYKIKGDSNEDNNNNIDINSWIEYIEDRPYNDQRYYISNQKLKNLGWKIEIDIESGLNDLLSL